MCCVFYIKGLKNKLVCTRKKKDRRSLCQGRDGGQHDRLFDKNSGGQRETKR